MFLLLSMLFGFLAGLVALVCFLSFALLLIFVIEYVFTIKITIGWRGLRSIIGSFRLIGRIFHINNTRYGIGRGVGISIWNYFGYLVNGESGCLNRYCIGGFIWPDKAIVCVGNKILAFLGPEKTWN